MANGLVCQRALALLTAAAVVASLTLIRPVTASKSRTAYTTCRPIRNESVPKIIINYTIFFFLNCNQHFVIFKPFNRLRMLLDKIASVYFT